jgi:ABC-type amino acid transport substrate-binding protein
VSKDNPSLSADLTQAFANLMSDGWYERLLGKWGVEDGIVANFGINGGGAGD